MRRVREANVVIKDHTKVDLKIVLLYPSEYKVAVSTLSYHMLYYLANSYEEVAMEHSAFNIRDQRGIVSVESGIPISKFDIVMFTVHYELDYARIAASLYMSGIEPLRSKRSGGPLVVVGGPTVTANPSILSEIADVIVVGEMEGPVPGIIEAALQYDKKPQLLDALGSVRGVHVPSSDVFTGRFYVKDAHLKGSLQPIEQIQPLDRRFEPVFGRAFLEETSRGCIFACRFCLLGYRFNPPRHKPVSRIIDEIRRGIRANRTSKVTLISSSFFSHPQAKRVLERIAGEGVEASIPSLRIDTLDDESLELMTKVGQRTLTIAPEAGTERLRWMVGKFISDSVILDVASRAKRTGIRNVKLYFIYGLPGETVDDIKAIGGLVRAIVRSCGYRGREAVRVSANPFIPKPGTPLQWSPMEDVDRLRQKRRLIEEMVRGASVRFEGLDPKLAVIQAVLSLGGPEVGRLIVEWGISGGNLAAWRRIEKKYRELIARVHRPRSVDTPLPWSRFYESWEEETLKSEHENYIRGERLGIEIIKMKRGT